MQEDCCMSQVAAGKCDINAFHTITRTHTHKHTTNVLLVYKPQVLAAKAQLTNEQQTHHNMARDISLTLSLGKKNTLTHTLPWRNTCQSNGDTGKCSLYLVPFDEVASIPQCERNGGRLEFQCVDPRLSTGHRFTHTGTHTHECTLSDSEMLRVCQVRAETPQKSHRDVQQEQHPLPPRLPPDPLVFSFHSVEFSLSLFSYPSFLPSRSYSSSLLFCWCCIFQSQTETDAFVGDRICV